MVGPADIVIVTLLAIGATVVVGVLGYLIDKNSDKSDAPAARKPDGNGV
jgi:hypothetical protein